MNHRYGMELLSIGWSVIIAISYFLQINYPGDPKSFLINIFANDYAWKGQKMYRYTSPSRCQKIGTLSMTSSGSVSHSASN